MVDITKPHRRYNPLTAEWILVSPQRTKRPWNGAVEERVLEKNSDYDPGCYLCPGNIRASGEKNPHYAETFAFTNDHASLLSNVGNQSSKEDNFFIAHQENGTSRVICYSPSHSHSMAQLTERQIQTIILTWKQEYEQLSADPEIGYVQIFENKGAAMGASSPHPHCQIWANQHIPTIPAKEQQMQKDHPALLEKYEALEQSKNVRIIYANQIFTVLVPYWAVWPYETMILPRKKIPSLAEFSDTEITSLAQVLSVLTGAYDKIFQTSFPYSMGIHQAPTDRENHDEWQFHMHFYPPLLRSATIKKHYVGYEMMAEAQRDITPESAAQTIRSFV